MIRETLRSIAAEPAVPNPPRRVTSDWLVLAAGVSGVAVEAFVNPELPAGPDRGVLVVGALVLVAITLWRRSRPLAMMVAVLVVGTALSIYTVLRHGEALGLYTSIVVLLLPYSLGRWASGRHLLAGVGVMVVQYAVSVGLGSNTISENIVGFIIFFFPAELGAVVRYRASLRVRELQQVRVHERQHLARDLHDTVAHHVSAIAIRAQAGQAVAKQQTGTAEGERAAVDALEVIEREASRTLTEMRSMVQALRPDHHDIRDIGPQHDLRHHDLDHGNGNDDGSTTYQPSRLAWVEPTGPDPAGHSPPSWWAAITGRWFGWFEPSTPAVSAAHQPQARLEDLTRLADLDRLGQTVDGLASVEVTVTGDVSDLGSALESTVFRVGQESVTNAVKHAKGATGVTVSVVGAPDSVTITVSDDGRPPHRKAQRPELGWGLRGMAERVSLLGGEFEAGPAEPSGWVVRARLPRPAGFTGMVVDQPRQDGYDR